MKTTLISLMFALALALVSGESDAAKRFGGGNNVGKQRATPTQKEAAPAQAPAQAAPASTAAAAAKPSFMSRWGGMLAGLGIGVLLASMFGAQMGPIIGMILMVLAVAAVAFLAYRMFAGRRAPATSPASPPGSSPQFAGIGSRVGATGAPEARAMPAGGSAAAPAAARPSFEVEPFLRVAKTSFIRLQAANDAGDLDDIRDYTTPEMFAEISMQVKERGGATQRTEVVNLNAELADSAIEGDYEIASVRFYGLLRENDSANPEPFDEIWHVRRDTRDRKGSWLIAGIQQTA
ncbi:MAG: Tim44-like domain-containing protein [Pseudomonadota bacterium]|nr:Tim44-like domain-containing protein [Pseudomonadota bacterium]